MSVITRPSISTRRRIPAARPYALLPESARSLTAKQFFTTLPPESRYTLIEGMCLEDPSPIPFHQQVTLNLSYSLHAHLKAHRIGGRFFGVPVDFVVDQHNVYQPDLSYFSPKRAKGVLRDKITTVPEFVIEVLSPSTAKYDLGVKRRHYAANGVEEMWIVDPRKEAVAIYRFAEDGEKPVAVFSRPSDLAEAQVIPNWRISLKEIFAD